MKLDQSRPGFRRLEHGFWLWLLLTFLWIAANSSFAVESVATGALISAALAHIFARKSDVWQGLRFTPSRLYHFILYYGSVAGGARPRQHQHDAIRLCAAYRHQSRHRQGQDQIEIARRPAGFGELDRALRLVRSSSISSGRPARPLARHPDDRSGRSEPRRLPALSKNIWRKALAELHPLRRPRSSFFSASASASCASHLAATVIDRVAAVDMLTIVSISLMALYAIRWREVHLSGCRAGLWRAEFSGRPCGRPLS